LAGIIGVERADSIPRINNSGGAREMSGFLGAREGSFSRSNRWRALRLGEGDLTMEIVITKWLVYESAIIPFRCQSRTDTERNVLKNMRKRLKERKIKIRVRL
jgi:hypothetical protein